MKKNTTFQRIVCAGLTAGMVFSMAPAVLALDSPKGTSAIVGEREYSRTRRDTGLGEPAEVPISAGTAAAEAVASASEMSMPASSLPELTIPNNAPADNLGAVNIPEPTSAAPTTPSVSAPSETPAAPVAPSGSSAGTPTSAATQTTPTSSAAPAASSAPAASTGSTGSSGTGTSSTTNATYAATDTTYAPAAPDETETLPAPEAVSADEVAEANSTTEADVLFPEGIKSQGSSDILKLSGAQKEMLFTQMEGYSVERQMVVAEAYSLVGKVAYYYGGKSDAIGWDVRWGNGAVTSNVETAENPSMNAGDEEVTAESAVAAAVAVADVGVHTTALSGYGLDCSGYVSWVFNNAASCNQSVLVGAGTTGQWENSTETTWENAQPGDLVFLNSVEFTGPNNHVGIVVGWDEEGDVLVAHCCSGKGVIISEAKTVGFQYVRTPKAYENGAFVQLTLQTMATGDFCAIYEWVHSAAITMENARLGDYAFTSEPGDADWDGQVGVVLGQNSSGSLYVAYSSAEGVKLVAADKNGFASFRRPDSTGGINNSSNLIYGT